VWLLRSLFSAFLSNCLPDTARKTGVQARRQNTILFAFPLPGVFWCCFAVYLIRFPVPIHDGCSSPQKSSKTVDSSLCFFTVPFCLAR